MRARPGGLAGPAREGAKGRRDPGRRDSYRPCPECASGSRSTMPATPSPSPDFGGRATSRPSGPPRRLWGHSRVVRKALVTAAVSVGPHPVRRLTCAMPSSRHPRGENLCGNCFHERGELRIPEAKEPRKQVVQLMNLPVDQELYSPSNCCPLRQRLVNIAAPRGHLQAGPPSAPGPSPRVRGAGGEGGRYWAHER